MRIKLLLLIILFGSKATQAQWSTPAKSTLAYDFGETSDKFAYTTSETSIFKASYGKKQDFLPLPKSGTARVIMNPNSLNGSAVLNGDHSLTLEQPQNKGLVKFSLYGIKEASDVLYNSFNIAFNAESQNAEYVWTVGNYNSGMFTGGGAVYRANPEIFAALKWRVFSTENITLDYRVGSDASTTTTWAGKISTVFKKGKDHKVEVYCNNAKQAQTYIRAGQTYNLPENTYHLWVNDAQVGTDFPRSIETDGASGLNSGNSIAISNGTPLNGFAFMSLGKDQGGSANTVKLSNIVMSYK